MCPSDVGKYVFPELARTLFIFFGCGGLLVSAITFKIVFGRVFFWLVEW